MKVLIVCSATNKQIAPFIQEQSDSLQELGISIEFFLIQKKGIKGYLRSFIALRKAIHVLKPDIIHAHYGLSGLLANLQRQIPVITTFHGSDINDPSVFKWSRWAIRLSCFSIFVSQKILDIANVDKRFALLPCGVNTTVFYPINKQEARQHLGWSPTDIYILFAGDKATSVKNYPLARKATDSIPEAKLLEMKGHSRSKVNLLLNAADVALMTSFTEGSPQFIKEALACNCPIVSTEVGDVKQLIQGINGCFISTFDTESVAKNLRDALYFAVHTGRTDGRFHIEKSGLSAPHIAARLIEIYKSCLHYE